MNKAERQIVCSAWTHDGCILEEGYCLASKQVCHGGMRETRPVNKQILVVPCGALVEVDPHFSADHKKD